MKKILGYLAVILITTQTAMASCSIDSVLKPVSREPDYVSVIVALAFVVLLIYITGVIYTKLNVFGSKVVRKSRKNYEDDKIFILSTTSLGHNKSLHVIEVNGEKLLVGVSQTGIYVLKEFKDSLQKKYDDIEPEEFSQKEIEPEEKISNEDKPESEEDEDFGLYKKYL